MEAEQIARAASWTPLEAGQLLVFVANPECQFVQSGEQLLEILVQSLKRLEQEMQGETPSGFVLWDERSENSFRPKNELRISDYIKLHFERDIEARGIVVNREVEIRKGMGAAPGEQTDIHVDAIVKGAMGAFDRISIIVEVKGCWNRDVSDSDGDSTRGPLMLEGQCLCVRSLCGRVVCLQPMAGRTTQESHPEHDARRSPRLFCKTGAKSIKRFAKRRPVRREFCIEVTPLGARNFKIVPTEKVE